MITILVKFCRNSFTTKNTKIQKYKKRKLEKIISVITFLDYIIYCVLTHNHTIYNQKMFEKIYLHMVIKKQKIKLYDVNVLQSISMAVKNVRAIAVACKACRTFYNCYQG
jgi:hypothetical protein